MPKIVEFARARERVYCARTTLSGSGCLWEVQATRDGSPLDPDEATILGLSKVSTFNTGLLESQEERKLVLRRGLGGITRRGKHLVRSGGKLLERGCLKSTLTFATFTLPGRGEATVEAAAEWPKILNRLGISLRRELKRQGLPPHILGVTEIQERRFLREGGMPLHFHTVFIGRATQYAQWAISADRLREIWASAVSPALSEDSLSGVATWGASVDCQMVKTSVAGYLGKYMSKGTMSIQAVMKANPALVEFLPAHWYYCTDALRRKIDQKTAYGCDHAEAIAEMYRSKTPERFFRWAKEVEVVGSMGEKIADVLCYDLTETAMIMLGIVVFAGEALR